MKVRMQAGGLSGMCRHTLRLGLVAVASGVAAGKQQQQRLQRLCTWLFHDASNALDQQLHASSSDQVLSAHPARLASWT
jgi:hypothetical protein